jgi:aminoglycoside/choline kinase family phosphotransferase
MDAPPAAEDCAPFVRIAGLLRAAGLNAPEVLAQDLGQGFLLVSDLGNDTYLEALRGADAPRAAALMRDATDALLRWQLATRTGELPAYDEALLRRELALFPDWYCARHLGRTLSAAQAQALRGAEDELVRSALAQPRVYVHRDYMPRNLMVTEPNPGVLDFQDAVEGRSATTWCACCATPSSAGTRSGCSTGRCGTGKRQSEARSRSNPISPSSGAASSGWDCSAT